LIIHFDFFRRQVIALRSTIEKTYAVLRRFGIIFEIPPR